MKQIILKLIAFYNRAKLGEHPLGMLYFHRVLEKVGPYFSDDPTREEFIQLVKFLSQHFNLLPLEEAIIQKRNNTLAPLSLCFTFDNDYKGNHEIALPILEDFGIKAIFFIATKGIADGTLWNSRITHALRHSTKSSIAIDSLKNTFALSTEAENISAYTSLINQIKFVPNSERDLITDEVLSLTNFTSPPREMLDEAAIQQLDQLEHLIGAHTHSHSILGFQTDDIAALEVITSKQLLTNILKKDIEHFAFPNGLFDSDFYQKHMNMIRNADFKYGYSTNDGGSVKNPCNFSIPRFLPFRRDRFGFALSAAKVMGEHA